jgi:hypothetical protein
MDKDTIEKLREFAQHARDVSALIDQPGHQGNQFQSVVREMPKHPPDKALQSIQGQLGAVAANIDAYLDEWGL